jgi:hypothetical protein
MYMTIKYRIANSKMLYLVGTNKIQYSCCCNCGDCSPYPTITLDTDVEELTGAFVWEVWGGLPNPPPLGGKNGCSYQYLYNAEEGYNLTMSVRDGLWQVWLPAISPSEWGSGSWPYIRWSKPRLHECDFTGEYTQVVAENCTGGTCVVSIP